MTETIKILSLADLAIQVDQRSEKFIRTWHGEELAKQLASRKTQLDSLKLKVERIKAQYEVVRQVDPKVRIPKRRLSPRARNFAKLEEAIAIDITKLVEPDAIDSDGLSESLKEVEVVLLDSWQKFARPPKASSGVDGLSDLTEIKETVQKLRAIREQLDAKSKDVPLKLEEVVAVRQLQTTMTLLSDQIRTQGYPDEILTFLAQVRTGKGLPIAEVLKNPELVKWLLSSRNANSIRVIHDAALNTNSFHV